LKNQRKKKFKQVWTHGPLIDELDVEIRWQEEVRCIDGSIRPAGWAANYSACYLSMQLTSARTYRSLLRCIEAVAHSYCECREQDAWEAWRASQVWITRKVQMGNTITLEHYPVDKSVAASGRFR